MRSPAARIAILIRHRTITGTLLLSDFEEHSAAAVDALGLLLKSFGELIAETRAAAALGGRVDISAEARTERCDVCYAALDGMRPALARLGRSSGRLGRPAAELLDKLNATLPAPA